MDTTQAQTKPEDKMSFQQRISRGSSTDQHADSHLKTFGQERGGSSFPQHRLVVLCLGLLNAVLLIAAVVIGIYCVKARDGYLQDPNLVAAPLIVEMNFLRNQSSIVAAKVEAQRALAKERANYVQLKMQVKQLKTLTDRSQGKIETLHVERTSLQSQKSALEESCGRCPQGWLLLKSSCYYFSYRNASNSKKNWADSRADCIKQGSDLLVINNIEEQRRVADNMPKQSSGMWWQNGHWMGLTHVAMQGTWVWVNNVTEVETMYWRSGQPNHDGPQSGNCAAFYSYGDSSKAWYNGNCQEHLYNWICEKEPSQT